MKLFQKRSLVKEIKKLSAEADKLEEDGKVRETIPLRYQAHRMVSWYSLPSHFAHSDDRPYKDDTPCLGCGRPHKEWNKLGSYCDRRVEKKMRRKVLLHLVQILLLSLYLAYRVHEEAGPITAIVIFFVCFNTLSGTVDRKDLNENRRQEIRQELADVLKQKEG